MATKAVPANKRSIAQDKFTWTIPGTRKKITLKAAAYMTMNQAEALAEAGRKEKDIRPALLSLCSTAADREAFKEIPFIFIRTLLTDWQEDGKKALGK